MQHTQLFIWFRKSNKDFSYTIFPVKKINVEKVLKLWENCYLIILSIHILKLEISGCDNYALTGMFCPLLCRAGDPPPLGRVTRFATGKGRVTRPLWRVTRPMGSGDPSCARLLPTASSGVWGIYTPSSSSLGFRLPFHWRHLPSFKPLPQLPPKHSNQGFLLGLGCESIWGVRLSPLVRFLHLFISRSTCGSFGSSIRVCYSWSLLLDGYTSPV
jgi:hypothetical protein